MPNIQRVDADKKLREVVNGCRRYKCRERRELYSFRTILFVEEV